MIFTPFLSASEQSDIVGPEVVLFEYFDDSTGLRESFADRRIYLHVLLLRLIPVGLIHISETMRSRQFENK